MSMRSEPRIVLAIPRDAILREARHVCALMRDHSYSFAGIPGLPSVAALVDAVKAADEDSTSKATSNGNERSDLTRECRAVMTELRRVLTFHGETSGDETLRERLAKARSVDKRDGSSRAAVATRLSMWAALANEHRRAIEGLGGFETKTIARAKELADQLRSSFPRQEAKNATAARNAKLVALVELVRKVRLAARFVFRDQPQIARQFTSEYERKRRARSRRKKASAP
jgi:hypothetical protein